MGELELVSGTTVLQEYSVEDVLVQAAKLKDLMSKALTDGQHYGVIPGTKKPSLLKPGAEKINFMFRIGIGEPEVIRTDMPNNHREITIKTPMVHIPTGKVIAYGVGSCSTMESKYRYRNEARKCPSCGKETIIKGKANYGGGWLCWKKYGGCGAKFSDGDKTIEDQHIGKIENIDIADQYNTVLKMAAKRSYVDGTIKASAASDFFTQDVEDTVQGVVDVEYSEGYAGAIGNGDDRDSKDVSQQPLHPGAERMALEAEIGRLSTILGADSITAARTQVAKLREDAKAGTLVQAEHVNKLREFKISLESLVADK